MRDLPPAEVRRRVGDMRQLAEVRRSILAGGRETGVEVLDFRAGPLEFTVVAGRGMDIGAFRWRGIPLSWLSAAGYVHPTYCDPGAGGWLHGFFGGLLTTCGPDNVGPACHDEEQFFGQHGRHSTTPAEQLRYGAAWHGPDYILWAEATLRQVRAVREELHLTRRIETAAGSGAIRLIDRWHNPGTRPVPFMLLYHINFGYPLLQEGAEVWLPEAGEAAPGRWRQIQPPDPEAGGEVFDHRLGSSPDGTTTFALVNPAFAGGLGVAVRYDSRVLPHLFQWQMLRDQFYVVALEPSNAAVKPRAAARQAGALDHLLPGETREMALTIEVVTGDGLERLAREILDQRTVREAAP